MVLAVRGPLVLRRALLRAWRWLRVVLPTGHRAWRLPWGTVYLDVRESPMMWARALGLYEEPKAAAMRSLLRPGATFVDVGANKGDFALLAASLVGDGGRVLAFEPAPDNCRWIERSLESNPRHPVRLFELALGDADGEVVLHLNAQSGAHTLVAGRAGTQREVRVRLRPLDAVLAELGAPRVDALKLDVEGAEVGVLRGAERTLAANPDLVLLLDLHPQLGVDVPALGAWLSARGFGLYRMEPPWNLPLGAAPDLYEALARRVPR